MKKPKTIEGYAVVHKASHWIFEGCFFFDERNAHYLVTILVRQEKCKRNELEVVRLKMTPLPVKRKK